MSRTADYTIQGFLYQFNKTIIEILKAEDHALITVEGLVEDIDIETLGRVHATQCKYHEAQQSFAMSLIYKPVLQMLSHFGNNQNQKINYRLFMYVPNKSGEIRLSCRDLESILETKNKELQDIAKSVSRDISLKKFSKRLTIEFGKNLDDLALDVRTALIKAGLPADEIETLFYPNTIHHIANLSIKHDPRQRVITKSDLLAHLRRVHSIAISRWTLALHSYENLLKSKRKQLKVNLDKNSRRRIFLISNKMFNDFNEGIVNFIQDYLDKYHFKPAHINAPIFCLECTGDEFVDIRRRLYKKGIRYIDGYIADTFEPEEFFREPIVGRQKGRSNSTDFRLRLMWYTKHGNMLSWRPFDDMFVISKDYQMEVHSVDVTVEMIQVNKFQELKFILGISEVYE